MKGLEEIRAGDGALVAIIVRRDFRKEGCNFLTKEDFPLQMGINSYPKGERIKAHFHLKKSVLIEVLQELLLIRVGKVIVNLYDSKSAFLESVTLESGDLIFFAGGGHGLEICEDTTFLEIKQGPYIGREKDKVSIE